MVISLRLPLLMSLVLQLGVNPHCKHGSCPVPSAASSSSAAIIIVKTKGYEPLLVPLLWKQQIIICNITIHHQPSPSSMWSITTASTTKTLGILWAQRASCDQPLNKISQAQHLISVSILQQLSRYPLKIIENKWKADNLGQKSQNSWKKHSYVALILHPVYYKMNKYWLKV